MENEAVVFQNTIFQLKGDYSTFQTTFLSCQPEQRLTSAGRSLGVTEMLLLSIASLTSITRRLVIAPYMNKEYCFFVLSLN